MTSLIEKVREVINRHLEFDTIGPLATEEAIQVILREMMEGYAPDSTVVAIVSGFAKHNNIDLNEQKP